MNTGDFLPRQLDLFAPPPDAVPGSQSPPLEVCDIDTGLCRQLVLRHHYSGRMPGVVRAWGLAQGSAIVGCAVFGIPASGTLCRGVCGPEYSSRVLELSRLVIITGARNAASVLIGQALHYLGRERPSVVVSYADCNDHVGHVGYVYQATNWLYTGHASAEPIWLHPETGAVISYTRRHIDVKARALGLHWHGLKKVPQQGKHRYVFFAGDRRFRKAARKALRYPVLDYPKGPTRRHEGLAAYTNEENDSTCT
jgi:hypothetical protein